MRKKVLLSVLILLLVTTMMVVPVLGNGGDPIPGGSGQPYFYLEVLSGIVTDDDGDAIGEAEVTEKGSALLFVMMFPEYYPDFIYYGVIADGTFTIWGSVHAQGTVEVVGETLVLTGTWH